MFSTVPHKFWQTMGNQRKYFEWLAEELFIQRFNDWYEIKASNVYSHGGTALLANYGHSFVRAVTTVYPEHPWQLWKFVKVPTGYWKDTHEMESFLKWVEQRLEITSPQDWLSTNCFQWRIFCLVDTRFSLQVVAILLS
jgi:hypothetical protein